MTGDKCLIIVVHQIQVLVFFYVSAGRCAMYLGTTSLREMHLRVMTYVLTQCCFLFVYVHFGKAQ